MLRGAPQVYPFRRTVRLMLWEANLGHLEGGERCVETLVDATGSCV